MRNACHRLTRTDLADLRGVSHTGGAHSEPYEFGDLNRRQHQMVANSARGAASFAAATVVVRADWACYSAPFYGTVRRASARFSVTVRIDPKIAAAIAAIG